MKKVRPGLIVLSKEKWYGGGYCGICGNGEVVPQAVRYWDCDDGWKVGVLCEYCQEEALVRGPRVDDYAFPGEKEQKLKIDINASLGDLDSTYSQNMEF